MVSRLTKFGLIPALLAVLLVISSATSLALINSYKEISVGVNVYAEPQPGEPVGGIWTAVDKFSLLAPYIAYVATVILAVSISIAVIKYRKKQ